MTNRAGITLIEMLIAMAVLAIMFGVLAAFMGQQTRAVALSQAINEAEITARVIAEAVAQDFQLAGARAVRIGSWVDYQDIATGGCDEENRNTCVRPTVVGSNGSVTYAAPGVTPNGYAIYYRTSLDAIDPNCRRVDVAFVDSALYRSDVECSTPVPTIDVNTALFASNVTAFSVQFVCSASTVAGGAHPGPCYVTVVDPNTPADEEPVMINSYVRQAVVTVRVVSTGRVAAAGEMVMNASTPNLRQGIRYSEVGE